MSSSIKIEKICTDDFTMDYFKFGHGNTNVVMLPGTSVQSVMPSKDLIAEAYKIFENEYTVYLFGYRDKILTGSDIHTMAGDIAAAIDKLGLSKVVALGASFGGMVAMTLAIDHPEMVKAVIACSTCAKYDDKAYDLFSNWKKIAESKDAKKLYLTFGEDIYPKETFEEYRNSLIFLSQSVTQADLDRFITMVNCMENYDITRELGNIKCPFFYLGDKQDKVFSVEVQSTVFGNLKDKENFKYYMYDGYGHAAYDLAPDYKERIIDFLHG